nr:hypothetical protein GCM10025699_75670 [Microbacterium flavescens]
MLGTAAVIAAGTGTGVRRDAMGRGAVGSGAVDRLLSWRPLTRIGDVSYPLYLWHWPLLIIPALALERDLRPMELAAVAIASCALAALTHVTLERRLTPRLARRRPLTMAVAGLAAAAVVVGLASAALTNPVLATDAVVKAPTVDDVRAGPDATSVVPSNLAPSLADVGGSIPRSTATAATRTTRWSRRSAARSETPPARRRRCSETRTPPTGSRRCGSGPSVAARSSSSIRS